MTVKAGREMVPRLARPTRAEDEGCVAYVFYRRTDNPSEAVLYEQWRDVEALNAHIARLQRVFGPQDEQETYPATHHRRRLPKGVPRPVRGDRCRPLRSGRVMWTTPSDCCPYSGPVPDGR
jgi:antibiotic biosynthesis monooxygenase